MSLTTKETGEMTHANTGIRVRVTRNMNGEPVVVIESPEPAYTNVRVIERERPDYSKR